MNKDLTAGKPEKVLWQFCLPLFGSIIFQQLYNIADSFVAGKFISDNALAAVGNSYEITLIFIAFAFGCNIACSVIAALFFGAKQYEDLKAAVYTALIASSAVCILLMLVGMLCSDVGTEPTPPGTGVMAPTIGSTSAYTASPAMAPLPPLALIFSGSQLMETSMTIWPSET